MRHVGNDELNCVCHSSHGANHRSTNFEKPKMCKNQTAILKSLKTV